MFPVYPGEAITSARVNCRSEDPLCNVRLQGFLRLGLQEAFLDLLQPGSTCVLVRKWGLCKITCHSG